MFVLLPGRARVDLRLERLGLEGGHYKQHQSQTRGKIQQNTYFPSTEKGSIQTNKTSIFALGHSPIIIQ